MIALPLMFVGVMWALPSLWWSAPLMVVFIPLMGALNGSIRGLTELRQHQLDEREGRTRDAAFRKMFWPIMAVAFIGMFLSIKSGLTAELRVAIGMATFILVMTAPTLYLAWTLPDDAGDED